MLRKTHPRIFGYGLAVGLFLLTLAVSLGIKYLFGSVNMTIVVFIFLVIASWYGGTGPGLLLAILVEGTSVALATPQPELSTAKIVFGHVTVGLVLFSFVWIVSTRKRAEDSLRQQRELLQVSLSSIGDAVIATDVRGRINFLNPTAESLTGWTQAEAAGKQLDEIFAIVDEQTQEPLENAFSAIRRNGVTGGPEEHSVLVPRDGTAIPIDHLGAPIKSSDGELVGSIIVFRDISERRRAEHEREELLLGAQAARSEAETANRLKDEFLATVSHELRTPLNAILGWAAMMRQKSPGESEVSKGLRVIERNAKTQNEIISDILDVSRIVTGKLRVEAKAVNLVPAIRAAVDTVYPAAEAKSITITTSFFDSNAVVIGDPSRLQQIFWNLISNAVRFTPKKGRVDIRLLKVDSNFEIIVEDTGVGISDKFLPYVFERFRQVDSSIKRTHGGLGLGLAIVRHLAELHGGSVFAASEGEGKGSTFSLKLPAAAPEHTPLMQNAAAVHDLTGLRVLVVDDEPDTVEILCLILEQHGAQTHAAASCAAAMEILSDWKPDLIVSDLGMPGEDGFDLIDKIRALEPSEGGNIPAAALTAYVREEDCLEVLAAGFQMHIPKPVDPGMLTSAVADLAKYRHEIRA